MACAVYVDGVSRGLERKKHSYPALNPVSRSMRVHVVHGVRPNAFIVWRGFVHMELSYSRRRKRSAFFSAEKIVVVSGCLGPFGWPIEQFVSTCLAPVVYD